MNTKTQSLSTGDNLTSMVSMTILVTGASRSGKSRWAEYLIRNSSEVCYMATGNYDIKDENWTKRIRIHQERRPKHWDVIETSLDLVAEIQKRNQSDILIDSLGGFVAAHIDKADSNWIEIYKSLIKALKDHLHKTIIVIEEVGWGVVPETSVGNRFRDRLGELSQKLEFISNQNWLTVQGRAIDLRKISISIPPTF